MVYSNISLKPLRFYPRFCFRRSFRIMERMNYSKLLISALLLTGMAWADPLGTARATDITCPSGSESGTCYAVTVSCPNVSDFTGYVKVSYPEVKAIGTVIFTTGGNGNFLYESYTYGTTALNGVLQAGYTVAQISWGEPFATQPYGWQTGPGGIRAVACRFATLASWIYTNIHRSNKRAPLCATGNSAGGEVIGLALAHYGLTSIFAMVEPTSGPPFARQDWACDCLHADAVDPCGNTESYCVGMYGAVNFIDPAYPGPYCSDETQNHTTSHDFIFLQDSILAPDASLSYPTTSIKFLYGGADHSAAPNQGRLWEDAITSSKSSQCLAGAPHEIPDVLEGAEQIASDIINNCDLSSLR